MTEHPPLPPLARLAEILEYYYLSDPPLMCEFLGIARSLDTAMLARVFATAVVSPNASPNAPSTTAVTVQAPAGDPAPTAAEPAEASPAPSPPAQELSPYEREVARLRANLDASRWDATGKRITSGESAFPRRYEPRQRPPGTSWLSD